MGILSLALLFFWSASPQAFAENDPKNGIGRLELRFAEGLIHTQCTAFLIDERFALTAAHCVYRNDRGLFPSFLSFSLSDEIETGISRSVSRVYFPSTEFKSDLSKDYALIELALPVKDRAIPLLEVTPGFASPLDHFSVMGFPTSGFPIAGIGKVLVESHALIPQFIFQESHPQARTFYFQGAHVEGGHSGSPALFMEPNGRTVAVGVASVQATESRCRPWQVRRGKCKPQNPEALNIARGVITDEKFIKQLAEFRESKVPARRTYGSGELRKRVDLGESDFETLPELFSVRLTHPKKGSLPKALSLRIKLRCGEEVKDLRFEAPLSILKNEASISSLPTLSSLSSMSFQKTEDCNIKLY